MSQVRLTIFGVVAGVGSWCDFARWGPIVTHLVQKVNGFSNQQNLESEREKEEFII